ncbi:hypothetical protein BDY24DRAFT_417579 [Mrakia frigida]|uniref:uncharacterized protein n=1 Tax=Mrakia frigida TaxID=29902 RepID=UPI003FCBF272
MIQRRPLLNGRVQISRRKDFTRIIARIGIKQLSISVKLDLNDLQELADGIRSAQPRRNGLTLFLPSSEDDLDDLIIFFFPSLIQLLRPGTFRTHASEDGHRKEYSLSSYASQSYTNLVTRLSVPCYELFQHDPSTVTLLDGFKNSTECIDFEPRSR